MGKKLLICVGVLLLLGGILTVVWIAFDWPPPQFILKYGVPPTGGPSGRRLTVGGIEFIEIGPTYFKMGSSTPGVGRGLALRVREALDLFSSRTTLITGEEPEHWVEFSSGFWISRTEVTNGQFTCFGLESARRAWSPMDEHPVVGVSWGDCVEFGQCLTSLTGVPVRLPTEAEWECAGRASSSGEHCSGNEIPNVLQYSWFTENSGGRSHVVGALRSNAWGLFDFDGNVSEWCSDSYRPGYQGAPEDGSAWISEHRIWSGPPAKVVRGSSFNSRSTSWRIDRFSTPPEGTSKEIGLRLAFVQDPQRSP